MQRHLDELELPFEFFEAVNGRALTAEELSKVYDRNKAQRRCYDLSLSEIGCALSHLGIYRKMLADRIEHALILEDDVLLNSEVKTLLEKLRKKYPADQPILILLIHVSRYLKNNREPVDENYSIVRPFKSYSRAHGYFITHAGAERLLKKLYPVWLIADHWPKLNLEGLLTVKALVPYVIGLHESSVDSMIGSIRGKDKDRKTLLRFCKRYINLELPRYLYYRLKYFVGQAWIKCFDTVLTQEELPPGESP